jgi:hypothetical protein
VADDIEFMTDVMESHCAWLDWLMRAELLADDREEVWKELFMDLIVLRPPRVLALAVSDTRRTVGVGGAPLNVDVGFIGGVTICVGVGGKKRSEDTSASF